MRQIDFNDLPRATRELFVRSLTSASPASSPICRRASSPKSAFVWHLLLWASAIVVGAIAFAYPRFGSLAAPVQGRIQLGAYVLLFFVSGLSLAMIFRRRALKGSLPFQPGIYVYPLDLVDARTRQFELYPLAELQSVDPVHHQTKGAYSHTSLWFVFPNQSFVFEVKSRERAEIELAAINKARQEISLLAPYSNVLNPGAFDPFADARARQWEPAHEHGFLARSQPTWTRSLFVCAMAIVCGLVFGVGAFRLRNWQSDARALAKLRANPDAALADTYVRGGGLHAAEVKNEIIPRARFAEAMKETNNAKRADAIDRFLRAYPKTAVEAEARAKLAETLHTEFLTQTTVAGLRTFVSRWPDSPDIPLAKTKMRELYQQTLVDFREHANLSDKSVVPVMEALLTWAEANPVPIEVRFRRRGAAPNLAMTDRLLSKGLLDDDGAAAKGGNAEITPHFKADAMADRETGLVRAFEHGFAGVFPADVFAFRVGLPLSLSTAITIPPPLGPIDDKQQATAAKGGQQQQQPPLPEVTAPTIVVDYEVGWAGTTYVSRDASRRFVGFFIKLELFVQIPKDPHVLYVAMKVEPPESFNVDHAAAAEGGAVAAKATAAAASQDEDVRVYEAMMQRALDQVGPKLIAIVFDARTAASRGGAAL